jgi:hypothetical protein
MGLLKINERVITGVAGMTEPPVPLIRGIECLTGDLPVKQIGLLDLVAVRFDAEISMLFTNPLHLPQRLVQIITVEIMQGV